MSCWGMVEKYFTALKLFQGFRKNLLYGWTAKYDELNDWHRAGTEREPNFHVFSTNKNRVQRVGIGLVMKLVFHEDPFQD